MVQQLHPQQVQVEILQQDDLALESPLCLDLPLPNQAHVQCEGQEALMGQAKRLGRVQSHPN